MIYVEIGAILMNFLITICGIAFVYGKTTQKLADLAKAHGEFIEQVRQKETYSLAKLSNVIEDTQKQNVVLARIDERVKNLTDEVRSLSHKPPLN